MCVVRHGNRRASLRVLGRGDRWGCPQPSPISPATIFADSITNGRPPPGCDDPPTQVQAGHRRGVLRPQERGARTVRRRSVDRSAGRHGPAFEVGRTHDDPVPDPIAHVETAVGHHPHDLIGIALRQTLGVPVDSVPGVVPGSVDEDEPGAGARTGDDLRVVGRRDVDGRTRDRSRRPVESEDGVELLVVVLGEEHVVVRLVRGRIVECEQQDESGQRRRRPAQQDARQARGATGEEPVVHLARIGIRDDDIRRSGAPVGRDDAVDATGAIGRHPCHLDPELDRAAEFDEPVVHRGGDPAEAAPDIPGAPGLFGPRHRGEGGRGAAGVRPGVGGVAVEQHRQAGVAQMVRTEPAQRTPRGDGPHVAGCGDAADHGPHAHR